MNAVEIFPFFTWAIFALIGGIILKFAKPPQQAKTRFWVGLIARIILLFAEGVVSNSIGLGILGYLFNGLIFIFLIRYHLKDQSIRSSQIQYQIECLAFFVGAWIPMWAGEYIPAYIATALIGGLILQFVKRN